MVHLLDCDPDNDPDGDPDDHPDNDPDCDPGRDPDNDPDRDPDRDLDPDNFAPCKWGIRPDWTFRFVLIVIFVFPARTVSDDFGSSSGDSRHDEDERRSPKEKDGKDKDKDRDEGESTRHLLSLNNLLFSTCVFIMSKSIVSFRKW